MARFAGAGDSVELPFLLAGARIICCEEAANSELAARYAHHHSVLDHQRSVHNRVTGFGFGDGYIPDRLAALRIKREQMTVDGSHKQRIAEDRQAAVHAPTADAGFGRGRILGNPEDT